MQPVHWEDPERQGFMMVLGPPGERLTVVFNRGQSDIQCALPPTPGLWRPASPDASVEKAIPPRSVVCWRETSG
jgi:glycogen operon protein